MTSACRGPSSSLGRRTGPSICASPACLLVCSAISIPSASTSWWRVCAARTSRRRIAFDFAADCGIYNVGTLESARRRGLATALTALHLHDALARGCRTASLQSTAMAERVYAAVGFRDLGRILEYVPAQH